VIAAAVKESHFFFFIWYGTLLYQFLSKGEFPLPLEFAQNLKRILKIYEKSMEN
jgi:hypothetical protein